MHIGNVRPALRERLGEPATADLLDLFDRSHKEWLADVTGVVGDRFERRLVEETSKLRIETTQGFAAVRQEMTDGFAAVRQDMTNGFAALRQEMTDGFASIRKELAEQRFEILKWVFLFWVGQFFAIASLMLVVIRYLRP